MKPNSEYGIVTRELSSEDIKEILEKEYKGTAELSNDVTAKVVSIVKYEED